MESITKNKVTRNPKLKSSSDVSISYGCSRSKSSYLSQFITKNTQKSKGAKPAKRKKDPFKSMNYVTPTSKINFSISDGKLDLKLEKMRDKVFAAPTKGRHRRMRSTVQPEMFENCGVIAAKSESQNIDDTKEIKPKVKKTIKKHVATFSPILEEDNYDNVIVKK